MSSLRLYALGSNGRGQLSLPHLNDTVTPELCRFDLPSFLEEPAAASLPSDVLKSADKVKKIVAGGNYTLVLFENGVVCVGGEVGSWDTKPRPAVDATHLFRAVLDEQGGRLLKCKDVAATWDAGILVAEDGKTIYVLGSSRGSGTGSGRSRSYEAAATPEVAAVPFIAGETYVESVAACLYHAVVILSNGECWGWGTARKGEIGEDAMKDDKSEIQYYKISEVGFDPEKVVCGKDNTLITGSQGSRSEAAYLGRSRWIKRDDLINLANESVRKKPHATWNSFYFHDPVDGSIAAIGRSDKGQLPPPNLPKIKKMAAGSEHVMALTHEGEVISWGWGEHGNCGPPPEGVGKSDIVADRWNVISLKLEDGWRVTDVGAGCATSFIVAEKVDR